MTGDARLDLGGIDVLSRRLDQGRSRPDEAERPVGFAPTEIVGVVPAAPRALGVELVTTEVSIHHGRPAHHDLADLTRPQFATIVIDDAHHDGWTRSTCSAIGG